MESRSRTRGEYVKLYKTRQEQVHMLQTARRTHLTPRLFREERETRKKENAMAVDDDVKRSRVGKSEGLAGSRACPGTDTSSHLDLRSN